MGNGRASSLYISFLSEHGILRCPGRRRGFRSRPASCNLECSWRAVSGPWRTGCSAPAPRARAFPPERRRLARRRRTFRPAVCQGCRSPRLAGSSSSSPSRSGTPSVSPPRLSSPPFRARPTCPAGSPASLWHLPRAARCSPRPCAPPGPSPWRMSPPPAAGSAATR